MGKEMLKKAAMGLSVALMSISAFAENTIVEMKTSMGNLELELFNDKAPISAKNFESYVKDNFYTGTIFHRVIPGFMVQGGGLNEKMEEMPKGTSIKNESYNGLKNTRGTLAMARMNHPDSASSQFFINVVNNDFLNKSDRNAGYAVFGQVTKGMEIVDQMVAVPTGNVANYQDVPKKAIKILNVKIKAAEMKKQ